MSNAIKFTPAKGTIQVSIKFIKHNDSVPSSSGTNRINTNSNISSWFINHRDRIVQFFKQTNSYSLIQSDSQLHRKPDLKTMKDNREGTISNIDDYIESGYTTNTPSDEESSNENVREERGMLVLEIKDSGAGISSENQKRLFKEIIQFNPEELQGGGGSGLGLWISKAIVDLHGGRLSVHSEGEGKGSTFRLEIPMTRYVNDSSIGNSTNALFLVSEKQIFNPLQSDMFALSSEYDIDYHSDCNDDNDNNNDDISIEETKENINGIVHDQEENIIETNNSSSRNLKFLVVDDSGTNRKFLCKLLSGRGHTCDEAVDGLKAVDMVKNNLMNFINSTKENTTLTRGYDAIFMDFVMPNLRGPDATIRIRNLGYTGPIIGLTGNAMQEDHDIFINAGASNVLVKPLEMDRLLEIIDL